MFGELFIDVLRNAVLITGLVSIMMMLIELFNIESSGKFFSGLKESRVGGVLAGAFLGAIPGCMGGFATVSLYTHGMLSFGALVAMMIASSGDESFIMLATIPQDALTIFCILFIVAAATGLLVDLFVKKRPKMHCDDNYSLHEADRIHEHSHGEKDGAKTRTAGWKRIVLFVGVAAFIAALAGGLLEHEHEHEHESECIECTSAHVHGAECEDCHIDEEHHEGFNILSEKWMNVLFAALSIIVLVILVTGSDHIVEEHLWHHIVVRHLPRIFAWTFGVLLAVEIGLHYFDLSGWISDNTVLMILLATAIGIIPESGPHMIFVTLYASGIVPLPVLLASCISQDGHASLPLLAESKKSFLDAKIINCAVALAVGFGALLLGA